MILVAGGTGFIGAAIVRRLLTDGSDVAVMTAHPRRSKGRIRALGAQAVEGDVRDAGSVQRAVGGADVVIQCLTFPTFPVEKPRKGYTFEEFDHRGTERLVGAAAAAGARKFLFCSGVGAAPDATGVRYRAKWAGEEAIRASAIDHAIIRPSWVYGPEDHALNRFVAFHKLSPLVPVIGDGSQRLQPVFVDDVAEAFAQAATTTGPSGTFEIGGPEVLSMDQILGTMMEVRGRRKPLIHVPPFLAELAGFFLEVLPKPLLSVGAVDIATSAAVADTGTLLRDFDLTLTPLREGLTSYLAPRPR